MKFRCSTKPIDDVLEIAPFCAVFLVLLLMLVLHSSLAPAPGVRIELPEMPPVPRPTSIAPELVVAIDQNGLIYFEHQVIGEKQLRDRLAAKVTASKQPVQLVLMADENVRQGEVLRLATLAKQCGINEVIMAVRPPLFPARPETHGTQ